VFAIASKLESLGFNPTKNLPSKFGISTVFIVVPIFASVISTQPAFGIAVEDVIYLISPNVYYYYFL